VLDMDTPLATLSRSSDIRREIYVIEGRLLQLAQRLHHDDDLTRIFRDLSDSLKRLKEHLGIHRIDSPKFTG
jgi:hypothetical protein